uniref:F-box protein At2g32560 family n=1 Tax=Cajanus cajan TaxID=3821 RepID=A0A151S275_CAJCA|nr:F-box protein At2g32560 family [Cajanus cajan]
MSKVCVSLKGRCQSDDFWKNHITLDFILKLLSPIDLCKMSKVCVSLKGRCQSDDFWKNHIKEKWGRVIGEAVYKEWEWHITIAKQGNLLNQRTNNQIRSLGSFNGVWPNLHLRSYLEDHKVLNGQRSNNFFMSLYFSLDSGIFWFPAQVYKGLMVHNALVSYDSQSDTFQARYMCKKFIYYMYYGCKFWFAMHTHTHIYLLHIVSGYLRIS